MKYDAKIHHRRSIRLPEYDYSQAGFYFVTICAQNHESLFGQVVDGQMRLNKYGRLVAETWIWLAQRYAYVELDEYVIMPNHLHGIIVISQERRGGSRTAPTTTVSTTVIRRKPLGQLIGAFKTVSTKRINQGRGTPGTRLWQRNY
jgi:REP element-mobilizing transposase RayT